MIANNNREGVEKALGMTEDQAIDEAWNKGHRQGLIEGRAMLWAELEHGAANTPKPHATPADITLLWQVIDQLKTRVDALEAGKTERGPSAAELMKRQMQGVAIPPALAKAMEFPGLRSE